MRRKGNMLELFICVLNERVFVFTDVQVIEEDSSCVPAEM